jgi:hypothetical protein
MREVRIVRSILKMKQIPPSLEATVDDRTRNKEQGNDCKKSICGFYLRASFTAVCIVLYALYGLS